MLRKKKYIRRCFRCRNHFTTDIRKSHICDICKLDQKTEWYEKRIKDMKSYLNRLNREKRKKLKVLSKKENKS